MIGITGSIWRGWNSNFGMTGLDLQIQNRRFGLTGSELQIQNSGFRMTDFEWLVRNDKFGMTGSKWLIWFIKLKKWYIPMIRAAQDPAPFEKGPVTGWTPHLSSLFMFTFDWSWRLWSSSGISLKSGLVSLRVLGKFLSDLPSLCHFSHFEPKKYDKLINYSSPSTYAINVFPKNIA